MTRTLPRFFPTAPLFAAMLPATPLLAALLLAATLLAGCITDPELKLDPSYVPADRGDGWTVSTPAAEGIDQAGVEAAYRQFYSDDRFRTAISMLVIRNGRLVAEGYCRDPRDVDVRRNVKSCTKSVTSLLTGIALDRGLIGGLDRTIYSIIPEYFDDDPAKRQITLRQALTMETGLDFDNDEQTEDLVVDQPESSLRFILARPMSFPPGRRFHYNDGNPHLIGGVLERVTGMPLEEFARRELFGPLGITDLSWEKGKDGLNYGAFGLYLKPRDMARIGQLMLQRGRWNGRQIVPESWIDESTSIQTNRNTGPYGYYWWIRPDDGGFMAAGHGGNYIYVIPEKSLVVVITALPYTDGIGVSDDELEDVVRMLVDAAR